MTTHTNIRRVVAVLAVLAALTAAGAACRSTEPGATAKAPVATHRYHCPMHPTVVSDKPGSCPICGMDLVPIDETPSAGPAGMPPLSTPGASAPGVPAAGVDGRAVVTLSSERRNLLGVRSEPVREQAIERTLRTVGRVATDERRVAHVHTKFEGFVERLYVDFTGKLVRKGEPLLSVYSPELVAAQHEYLLARRAQKQFAGSQIPSLAQGGSDLLEAARQRLLLWDIRAEDIEQLERTGTVRRTFDLYAEVGGFAVHKNVVQGMRVMPADTLFEIADLSHVWVLADVYDADLAVVRQGLPAAVSLSSIPGRTWRGVVTNIAPVVEQQTRTVKVRVEVDNPDLVLLPDMYGDITLTASLGRGVLVPDSGVIDLGDRTIVFVDRADGGIEPRQIQLGVKLPDGYQVLRGL